MAALDKTYVSTYEEWKEIIDYAKNTIFHCPNGQEIKLLDSTIWPYKTESEIKHWLEESEEIPVMNTSQSVDYFLIKYCPIKLVQDRMKEVYGETYYNQVKNGVSKYDTFIRPESGKHLSFRKKPKSKTARTHSLNKTYYIQIYLEDFPIFYNEKYDTWLLPYELGIYHSNIVDTKCKSVKAVIRRIKKWNLPVGCRIGIFDSYNDFEMLVTK